MMSATRVTWMIRPVNAPASAAPAIRTSAITIPRWNETGSAVAASASQYFAERTLTRLIIEPIERSMPPEMITTACAIAAKANGIASITSDCTSNWPQFAGIVLQ